jgi:hypothetical protein
MLAGALAAACGHEQRQCQRGRARGREVEDERDIGAFLARTGGDAARFFLPGNVWIVSARTHCYRVEIYDGRVAMAVKYRLVTLFAVLFVSHLLIVDDDVEVLDLLQKFLRQHGYEVDVASDGNALWQALERRVPDLVILDVMLPG